MVDNTMSTKCPEKVGIDVAEKFHTQCYGKSFDPFLPGHPN